MCKSNAYTKTNKYILLCVAFNKELIQSPQPGNTSKARLLKTVLLARGVGLVPTRYRVKERILKFTSVSEVTSMLTLD